MVELPIMNAVRELVSTYDEYVKLLVDSERQLLTLAYAHGFSTPDNLVLRGKQLRERITELKAELPIKSTS